MTSHELVSLLPLLLAALVPASLQRFSMTWNGRGCLSVENRVNGVGHDRAVFDGHA
jgi:hypothetical protein